jgi:hypothetical protein
MSVKSPSRPTAGRARRYAVSAALLAVLTACSGSGPGPSTAPPPASTTAAVGGATSTTGSTGSTATPSTTGSTGSTAAGRSLLITVTGSTVTPKPTRVDLAVGATLTLVVTSDHDDQLHAHGFDVEAKLTAAKPTTIVLTGTDPGVFEVETHHPALTLVTVAVR